MFEKLVVVDCRAHMMGRLASIVAKELLNGQHVVLVRAEETNISGSLFRNKIKWADFRRKRTNTNPRKGPFHFRAPSRMLYRTIRGMIPHKTSRGEAALKRLRVFEGVPDEFQKMKRKVIPDALRVTRLKPGRDYCVLGRLATECGWKHYELIKRMEAARKVQSDAYYQKKKEADKARAEALSA
eukprot:CAMPEP_0185581418 /NCGR_PEP_ID=MMETSP0434-20130131/18299_1 /TAXON_ID=626734 ORGANISM="Favella taraikaensis, Strain Fe Narragansett Bay" /NCGR_SAMPLE_ID=MMETSP0434 /ASSEMBLY_ACC=CAM_ASM_000379 /LENGTH=183 /DNA_ID=CAMNT_0028199943 /DNA_START=15 /DNA_END=566 /DNA_ORIENTATION=-